MNYYGWVGIFIHGWMSCIWMEQIYRMMDGWIGRLMYVYVYMDGWMDGYVDVQMGGCGRTMYG